MSNSIFNIQLKYLQLMQELEDNGGEITEELSELLIQNEQEFKQKAENYIGLIKSKESDALLIKDEIDRLTAKKKRTEASINKLGSILLEGLKLYGMVDKNGVARYKAGTFDLSTRKSSKVHLNGEDELKDALIGNMLAAVGAGTIDKEVEDIEKGNLVIAYNPPVAEDEVTKVEKEDKDTVPLNDIEVQFLNNNLSYNIKLDVKYTEMLKIARAINDFIEDPGVYVDYGIAIPKKEASAIVKSNKGFRLATMVEDKKLVIK